jgi:acylpyruvate hydrolase
MDKIICLGKNYSDHITEMKEAAPEMPVIFLKPPSVLKEIKNNSSIILPWERGVIHHELEIVFKLYKKNIIAIGAGLDLTLRETQKKLKENGHPWEISKVFRNSALVTPLYSIKDFKDWKETPFTLKVNGEVRQSSNMSKALVQPDEIILYIDKYLPLCDGDLIFTGTPSGVGPLKPNDQVEINFGPVNSSFRLVENG